MISTHILDTSKGSPASGVEVRLQKAISDKNLIDSANWLEVSKSSTNADGRIVFDCEKAAGVYRLIFEISDYLKQENKEYFFLQAPVVFKIEDVNRKYHIPLLLNPFGFSTYRGS